MMRTLKTGCNGDEVKTLQKLLNKEGYNLVVDSDFGQKTHDALVAWQKAHGLVADGIVGPKTWAALMTVAKNATVVDPSVIYMPLKSCITKTPNRTIRYIAIHYTAGASSAPGNAKTMKAGWEKAKRASADFGVDDGTIVQFNPDLKGYRCWSVGDKKNPYSGGGQLYKIATNSNTLSIEICSNLRAGFDRNVLNHGGWYFTEESLANAVKLTKILMKKFNVPIERVVRHYDISGKVCPSVLGWNNAAIYTKDGKRTAEKSNSSEWEKFKNRLK